MHVQLTTLLKAHQPANDIEAAHRQQALDFVSSNPACSSRHNPVGHVTASAWILSPDGSAALLTHHKKLNRWLQLGGHLDHDASIQTAAAREAREESGIDDLQLLSNALFDVDVHLIPARKGEPDHYHYDLRFLFRSPSTTFKVSEESHDLAWVGLVQLAADESNESVSRMARKTLSHVSSGMAYNSLR